MKAFLATMVWPGVCDTRARALRRAVHDLRMRTPADVYSRAAAESGVVLEATHRHLVAAGLPGVADEERALFMAFVAQRCVASGGVPPSAATSLDLESSLLLSYSAT